MRKRGRKNEKNKELINLKKFSPSDPFSQMSRGGRKVAEGVLKIIEKNFGRKAENEDCIYYATEPFDQLEVLDYLRMYFVDFSDVDSLIVSANFEIFVDMKIGRKLEERRRKIERETEGILSSLYEGDEEEMTKEIASFLLKEMKKGKRKEKIYPLLFRSMVSRLGIRCDVCTGFVSKQKYHLWNVVFFSNGERKYFDLIAENKSIFRSYVDTTKSPHKVAGINHFLLKEEAKLFVEKNF